MTIAFTPQSQCGETLRETVRGIFESRSSRWSNGKKNRAPAGQYEAVRCGRRILFLAFWALAIVLASTTPSTAVSGDVVAIPIARDQFQALDLSGFPESQPKLLEKYFYREPGGVWIESSQPKKNDGFSGLFNRSKAPERVERIRITERYLRPVEPIEYLNSTIPKKPPIAAGPNIPSVPPSVPSAVPGSASKGCDDAVIALRDLKQRLVAKYGMEDSSTMLETLGLNQERLEWATKLHAYETYCLMDVDAAIVSGLAPKEIREISGVLVARKDDGGWLPFCSATRISPDSLLTARHCFFSKADGLKLEYREVRFVTLAGPSQGYMVAHNSLKTETMSPIGDRDDYLTIKTDFGSEPSFSSLQTKDAKDRDDLLLVSLYLSARVDSAEEPKMYSRMLRVSEPTACIVGLIAANCVYHGCQSDPGSSGGGLFTRANVPSGWGLIGVHIGGAGMGYGCDASKIGQLGNVGVSARSMRLF